MLSPSRLLAVGIAASLPFLSVTVTTAQEKAKPKSEARSDTKKPKKRAARGRIPNGWSQLGLTNEQKTKIYSAQAASKAKVAETERKLDELRAQTRAMRLQLEALRAELRAALLLVLTPEQRKQVERMEAARRKAKAASDKAKAESSSKDSR